MNISTKEICEISNLVLSFISKHVEEISLDDDLYQLIGSDEWYDISILKQITEEKRVVSISDLDRLSSIFRAISQHINPL